MQGFQKLGYDAVNLAERDFMYGQQFLLTTSNDYDIALVSANIYNTKSGKPFVARYLFRRFGGKELFGFRWGGRQVGIFGLTTKNKALWEDHTGTERNLEARDPIAAAKEVVAEVRAEVDLLICLASMGTPEARRLAKEVAGIDVMIVSNSTGRAANALVIGKTRIVETGNQGKLMGDLSLALDGSWEVTGYRPLLTPLTASYKDDQQLGELVLDYKKAVADLRTKQTPSRSASGTRFAGAVACKSCHAKQYLQWTETPHAHALDALRQKNSQNDPECQRCHTTGFEEEGGFATLGSTLFLADVQCEVCHGPQYSHTRSALKIATAGATQTSVTERLMSNGGFGQISSKTCLNCHTEETDPGFEFRAKILRVSH